MIDLSHKDLERGALPVDFDPFEGPVMTHAVPATEPQQELWVACLMGADDANRSYNESVSLRLSGSLDQWAMESAIRTLIQRHEALRSAFSADGKYLCIYQDWPLSLLYQDLSAMEPLVRQAYVEEYAGRDARTTFDLVHGPLFRTALFKLATSEYYLRVTAHHIICDGWSLGILLQDLGRLYSSLVAGEEPSLEPASSISEYAKEYWEFCKSPAYEKIEKYWVDQFKGDIPQLDLPLDLPRPTVRTYKSHRDDFPLDSELVASLKQLGLSAGCSFVTTLLAGFEVFLHRLTGQQELVLGLPAAGQSYSGHQGLVGHCVNLLPLRSRLDGSLSFLEYLRQRKAAILNDYEHQQFTLGSLLKKINVPRDPARIPLVPVVFNIDLGLDNGVEFAGLTYRMVYNPREYENFEIFLNISGSEQALVTEWSYNTQLFTSKGIARRMQHFEFLLRAIAKNPEAIIGDLPRNSEEEQVLQVPIGDETTNEYPRNKPLMAYIRETAALYPARPALRFRDEVFTYGKMGEMTAKLSRLLQQYGVQKGDIVALAVDRSPSMLMGMLAIMQAGAAYLPVDPEYPAQRIAFMVSDSGAKFLITTAGHAHKFQSNCEQILMEHAWKEMEELQPQEIFTELSGEDLAYLLYTSGSTGKPKAVQVSHRNLMNFLLSMQRKPGMNLRDRLLAVTTISFDIAGLELFLPLLCGAEIILAEAAVARDGRLLLEQVKKDGITVMQATPSTWRMMIDAGWENALPLKVLCGGEALSRDLADKLLRRCQSLWNMYGPTETTIWSTVKEITQPGEVITIGRPIFNTRIYILDDYLKPLAAGSVGEIYIGGDGVAKGYLNRPELTESRFITDPFSTVPGEKMYRTGDLGKYLANGELVCLGRADHQVKIRGHRIELGEIEESLTAQMGVKESVVIAREDRLLAFVVPQDMSMTDDKMTEQAAAWKQGLQAVLPAYMVPAELIPIKQLPLTPNGKIDRNALPSFDAGSAVGRRYLAPRTETEKLVAEIWAEFLGLNKVGIQDDFFELGGHSMVAVQVMTRLEKETGKRLPLATLFEAPTVEKLAACLSSDEKPTRWDSLVPIKPQGSKMPLYIVHGFGMNVLLFNNVAKNMDEEQPVYALQAKGLNASDETLDKMEDIAAYYVSEILEQNPTGPYAIAGYSFGGIIAFEMAKQLKSAGKEVKMLGMFDTYADNSDYFDPWLVKFRKKFLRQFPKMMFVAESLVKRPLKTIAYQVDFIKRVLHERLGMFKSYQAEDYGMTDEKILQKYEFAYRHYQMTPYEGAVDVFKVRTRLYFLDDLEFLGWKPFAQQGVNVHEIAGDHKTFLFPPHARDFALVLQSVMDERAKASDSIKNLGKEHHVLKAV